MVPLPGNRIVQILTCKKQGGLWGMETQKTQPRIGGRRARGVSERSMVFSQLHWPWLSLLFPTIISLF